MWTKEELDRYHRQMILPGVGPEGQERLKRASVSYTHLTLPTTPYV